MGEHALSAFNAEQENGVAGPGRIEQSALEPDIELAARHPVGAFERRSAAVRKTQQHTELRPRERAVWRVEGRGPGRLGPRITDERCHDEARTDHRYGPSHVIHSH